MRYNCDGRIRTMTLYSSSSSLELAALRSWSSLQHVSPPPRGDRNSMPWWYSFWKAVSASRFTSPLLALWRLCAPVVFLALALLWVFFSIASDYEYRFGLTTLDPVYFQRAAALFPIMRDRRMGPLWSFTAAGDVSKIAAVERIAATDPHAADVKLALAKLLLKAGRKEDYNAVMTQLEKLTPKIRYQLVQLVPAQPR